MIFVPGNCADMFRISIPIKKEEEEENRRSRNGRGEGEEEKTESETHGSIEKCKDFRIKLPIPGS